MDEQDRRQRIEDALVLSLASLLRKGKVTLDVNVKIEFVNLPCFFRPFAVKVTHVG